MSQVWLITGASRELGRAIADAALAAGHSVVATTRSGKLDKADPQFTDRLLVLPLDVTKPDEQAYTSVVESAVDRFGRIDVLVNNAGRGMVINFEETNEAQVRDLFETNVFGLMRVTRAVLLVMRNVPAAATTTPARTSKASRHHRTISPPSRSIPIQLQPAIPGGCVRALAKTAGDGEYAKSLLITDKRRAPGLSGPGSL